MSVYAVSLFLPLAETFEVMFPLKRGPVFLSLTGIVLSPRGSFVGCLSSLFSWGLGRGRRGFLRGARFFLSGELG